MADQFPDPLGPITDKYHFLRQIRLPLTGGCPKKIPKLLCMLDITMIADLFSLQFVLLADHTAVMTAGLI
jgi:hypothetical protein